MIEEELSLETKHYNRVVNAFQHYESVSLRKIRHLLEDAVHLNDVLLGKYIDKLQIISSYFKYNQNFFNRVVEYKYITDENKYFCSASDLDNLKCCLRQVVRDWSDMGSKEREMCYQPILHKLSSIYKDPKGIQVLVPGAGLGRLCYEIAKAGFDCQGNEFSLFMLLISEYFLNQATESTTIYPYLLPLSNSMALKDHLFPVDVPDIFISEGMIKSEFSMVAGDFLQVYKNDHGSISSFVYF